MAIDKGTAVISTHTVTGPTDLDFVVMLPAFVAGNVWIAMFFTRGIVTITPPAGWSAASAMQSGTSSTDAKLSVFTRVPDGGEGVNATFTTNTEFGGAMLAAVYPMSGVDTNEIFASSFGSNGATLSGPVTGSPVTNTGTITNYSDSFLFNIQAANLWSAQTGVSLTEPENWTNDLNATTPQTFDRNIFIQINHRAQPILGATGSANGLLDSTESTNVTWLSAVFALKDADGVPNQAPTVDVGANINAYQGVSATLTASANDPEGQALTYLWERISGPVGGTIVSPTSPTTEITDLFVGTYTFRCTATDTGNLSGSDELDVIVQEVDYKTAYIFNGDAWQRRRMRVYRNGSWE